MNFTRRFSAFVLILALLNPQTEQKASRRTAPSGRAFTEQALAEPAIAETTSTYNRRRAAELRAQAARRAGYVEELIPPSFHARVRAEVEKSWDPAHPEYYYGLLNKTGMSRGTMRSYFAGEAVKLEALLKLLQVFGRIRPTLAHMRTALSKDIRAGLLAHLRESPNVSVDVFAAEFKSNNRKELNDFLHERTDHLASDNDLARLFYASKEELPKRERSEAPAIPIFQNVLGDSLDLLPEALHRQIQTQLNSLMAKRPFLGRKAVYVRTTMVSEDTLTQYLNRTAKIPIMDLAALLHRGAPYSRELRSIGAQLYEALRSRLNTFEATAQIHSGKLRVREPGKMIDFLNGHSDPVGARDDLLILVGILPSGETKPPGITHIPAVDAALETLRPYLLAGQTAEQEAASILVTYFQKQETRYQSIEALHAWLDPNKAKEAGRTMDSVFRELTQLRSA